MTAPDPRDSVTVGFNDDGSLDEVCGTGDFHLEQMDTNAWWMQLGPHMVWLRARGKITATFGKNEAQPALPQQEGGEDAAQRTKLKYGYPQFFRPPFRVAEQSDGSYFIVDSTDYPVASMFWPLHPPERTEEAEQETLAMAEAFARMGSVAGGWDKPFAWAVWEPFCDDLRFTTDPESHLFTRASCNIVPLYRHPPAAIDAAIGGTGDARLVRDGEPGEG